METIIYTTKCNLGMYQKYSDTINRFGIELNKTNESNYESQFKKLRVIIDLIVTITEQEEVLGKIHGYGISKYGLLHGEIHNIMTRVILRDTHVEYSERLSILKDLFKAYVEITEEFLNMCIEYGKVSEEKVVKKQRNKTHRIRVRGANKK